MNADLNHQKAKEMRQVELVLMESVLMIASVGDYKDFSNTEDSLKFSGANFWVEMDKTSGALRVYRNGQAEPLYDSHRFDDCVNLDLAWEAAFHLTTEIQRAVSKAQSSRR